LLTLFRYKVRECFKNSLGWWVGFGRLGSFGFLKRWFVCREKPNVPNTLAKNFLEGWVFFIFFCVGLLSGQVSKCRFGWSFRHCH